LSQHVLAFRNPLAAKFRQLRMISARSYSRCSGLTGWGGGSVRAGYYDRFLSKHLTLRKIGVAFACQEFDGLPVDENDIRMDYIITEDGIVYPHGGSAMRSTERRYLTPLRRRSPSGCRGLSSRQPQPAWAYKAAVEATGFASSKIGCPCEAGIEQYLSPEETPDGRAGVSILICADKKNMNPMLPHGFPSVSSRHRQLLPLTGFPVSPPGSISVCTISATPV